MTTLLRFGSFTSVTLLLRHSGLQGSSFEPVCRMESFCVKFPCSPSACMGFLWVQIHICIGDALVTSPGCTLPLSPSS